MELFPEDTLPARVAADVGIAEPRSRVRNKDRGWHKPLPEELRPRSLADLDFSSIVDNELIQEQWFVVGHIPSLLLWGPPGTGKTSFARLFKSRSDLLFVEVSGLDISVSELRSIIKDAGKASLPVLLFVDEIHRLTRPQQDSLLAAVESGVVILVGATTENPGFVVSNALLSRLLVISFSTMPEVGLERILSRGAEALGITLDVEATEFIVDHANGDARRLLYILERVAAVQRNVDTGDIASAKVITLADVRRFAESRGGSVYGRGGDERYDIVSAFIKSLRGSDPDAALYWGVRMLEGGEDPRFLCRRLIIFASEDIGNADPRALPLAIATAEAYERVGLPEGAIPIAHCITFLATTPKSNRSYLALKRAKELVRRYPIADVPMHLRNAPTAFAAERGHGEGYEYPHDREQGFAPSARYLPDAIEDTCCYEPSSHGYEAKIGALREERIRHRQQAVLHRHQAGDNQAGKGRRFEGPE